MRAESFQDATRQAYGMQQDPENEATVFDVRNTQGRRLLLDATALGEEEKDTPIVCPGCGRDNADSDRLDHRCGACSQLAAAGGGN